MSCSVPSKDTDHCVSRSFSHLQCRQARSSYDSWRGRCVYSENYCLQTAVPAPTVAVCFTKQLQEKHSMLNSEFIRAHWPSSPLVDQWTTRAAGMWTIKKKVLNVFSTEYHDDHKAAIDTSLSEVEKDGSCIKKNALGSILKLNRHLFKCYISTWLPSNHETTWDFCCTLCLEGWVQPEHLFAARLIISLAQKHLHTLTLGQTSCWFSSFSKFPCSAWAVITQRLKEMWAAYQQLLYVPSIRAGLWKLNVKKTVTVCKYHCVPVFLWWPGLINCTWRRILKKKNSTVIKPKKKQTVSN